MERSVVIAGFGGQGVILAGKILAQAGMDHGLEVTWLPSYGPEMRGGTANCTVVTSDSQVGSPIVDEPSALVAMNRPSLEKFADQVAAGGTILINSSLIESPIGRSDVQIVSVPLNDLAAKIGNARTINMIALGALVKATSIVPLETLKKTMKKAFEDSGKAKVVAVNTQALDEGYNAA